jgi:hypothetical protein
MQSGWAEVVRARKERKDPAEILAKRITEWFPSLEPHALAMAREMLDSIAKEEGYLLVPKRDVVETL